MFNVTPAMPSRTLTPHDLNIATRMTTSPGGGVTVPRRFAARSFWTERASVRPGTNWDSGTPLSTWRMRRTDTRGKSCHQLSRANADATALQSMAPTNPTMT
jgi:hypothetical protein